ncbi:MAG: SDR family NAD(P)-dependent oxidoreductase [Bryobacter sp.]|nr:SDR family NAD(P)-dependent oxidoreductase [Bryobacter sp.]
MSAGDERRMKYGPWAVVTGASDGIGRAIAEQLAKEGFALVLVARREERLQELARGMGKTARVLAVDLSEKAGWETVLRETEDLDVGLLVAAAGFGTTGEFIANPLEAELAMLATNCGGTLALAHGFGQRMAKSGRGGMILFSSLVAFQGVPRTANYAATKAYVQTLAEGLRRELRPKGVEVLATAPGPVRTGFGARARMQMGMAAEVGEVARDTLNALGRQTTVRPGGLAKLLGYSLITLPRGMRTLILEKIMAGMTRHDDESKG